MQVLGVIYLVALVGYGVGYAAAGRAVFPLSAFLSALTVISGFVLAVNAI